MARSQYNVPSFRKQVTIQVIVQDTSMHHSPATVPEPLCTCVVRGTNRATGKPQFRYQPPAPLSFLLHSGAMHWHGTYQILQPELTHMASQHHVSYHLRGTEFPNHQKAHHLLIKARTGGLSWPLPIQPSPDLMGRWRSLPT